MARITIDGTPKTFGTKLEIDPNNWDLKHGRVQGKSVQALSINKDWITYVGVSTRFMKIC